MGIQRWTETACVQKGAEFSQEMRPFDKGMYVLFTDHEQVVAELEAKLSAGGGIAGAAMEQITKLATERDALRAELAAKSKDAERYAWVRENAGVPFKVKGEHLTYMQYHYFGKIDAAIDFVMGEGNGR